MKKTHSHYFRDYESKPGRVISGLHDLDLRDVWFSECGGCRYAARRLVFALGWVWRWPMNEDVSVTMK